MDKDINMELELVGIDLTLSPQSPQLIQGNLGSVKATNVQYITSLKDLCIDPLLTPYDWAEKGLRHGAIFEEEPEGSVYVLLQKMWELLQLNGFVVWDSDLISALGSIKQGGFAALLSIKRGDHGSVIKFIEDYGPLFLCPHGVPAYQCVQPEIYNMPPPAKGSNQLQIIKWVEPIEMYYSLAEFSRSCLFIEAQIRNQEPISQDFAKQLTNSFLGCAGVNFTGSNPLWTRLRINDQTIIEFMDDMLMTLDRKRKPRLELHRVTLMKAINQLANAYGIRYELTLPPKGRIQGFQAEVTVSSRPAQFISQLMIALRTGLTPVQCYCCNTDFWPNRKPRRNVHSYCEFCRNTCCRNWKGKRRKGCLGQPE